MTPVLQSPTLRRVVGDDMCTGCGLCAGIAPAKVEMTVVDPGYNRPRQIAPLDAAQEGTVAAACPGSTVDGWGEAPVVDPLWGPAWRIMTGHSTDPAIRFSGSSGGAVSALALRAMETGLVDRVLLNCADPEHPTRNVPRWATSRQDIVEGAGSRYAASSPLGAIDAALAEPGRFAFIGKPCDVSALRALALVDPRVDEKVPLMLSFFCAGVPSHRGADAVVRAMGFDPAEVESFRYRGEGWPGLARAVTAEGREATMTYEQSWGGHLSREVQFRCKICPDGVGGAADVACADAWYGGESGYPAFEEEEGRSLIVSRTAVGDRLLGDAMNAGAVVAAPIAIGEIALMQPAQARRKAMLGARLLACRLSGRTPPAMPGLLVRRAGRGTGLKARLREFLGTLKRLPSRRGSRRI